MAQTVGGQVGPSVAADNTYPPFRMGRTGDVIVSELHGRFYEQVLRGNVYTTGPTGLTALSANTIGLTATGTPIVGVWNPSTSIVNLAILQASLTDRINNVTSVDLGIYVWAASVGNSAISTGSAPINCRTLVAAGSQAKGFTGATALTGLTNTMVLIMCADFPVASGLLTTTVAASTPTPSVLGIQNFDGSIIVPPGGVFGLYNTVSVTTHSVSARLLWEEVPL